MQPFSLYIHIPFCTHRCGYCDFNTYAGLNAVIPSYVTALCREISFVGQSAGERLPLHSIYFGGGTPSLLAAQEIEQIINTIGTVFELRSGLEVTLEANPGTLSLPYLVDLQKLGINRLSLGVQSTHPDELRCLERNHTYLDVIECSTLARQAGFVNINMDLIFGLPDQDLQSWIRSLQLVSGLKPEHFSLYALTIEQGTPLGNWSNKGLVSIPDPDLAAEMYERAGEALDEKGYLQYEISNWAMRSSSPSTPEETELARSCRHNLQYWRNLPYIGIGAGAHGYAAGTRTANVLSPLEYIRKLKTPMAENRSFPSTPATQSVQPIDVAAEIGETMMMGLRLVREGISADRFYERFGRTLRDLFADRIERLVQLGLVEWSSIDSSERLRLTQRGYLLANQVFVEFI